MTKTYSKGIYAQLSDHFMLSEFECPCLSCKTTQIDTDLITKLEDLRKAVGSPLRINSGYRCESYQNELRLRGYETASGVSQHQLGRAADVSELAERLSGAGLEKLARSSGFSSVGVGHSWVHLDLREGYRRWEYKQR